METIIKDVSFSVPWGHISGLWYGGEERPILALHGWLDNCGSFAKLAPLISPYRSVLCIDLPGHGRSSHLPIGIQYNILDFLRVVRLIMVNYGWSKVSLMGHSMGGSIGFLFAAIYPNFVDMIISLDIIKTNYKVPKVALRFLYVFYSKMISRNNILLNPGRFEPPVYTWFECEQLLHNASQKSIELENCKYILERNVTKSSNHPDKYYFSRDIRLKETVDFYTDTELNLYMAKCICQKSLPYLVIKGGLSNNYKFIILEEYLNKNNPNFQCLTYSSGTHHLHLNNADAVAKFIILFLKKFKQKSNEIIQQAKL